MQSFFSLLDIISATDVKIIITCSEKKKKPFSYAFRIVFKMLNGKYKQQHKMILLCKTVTETYRDISDKLWNHVLKKRRKILKSNTAWTWAYLRY